jgi:plastocyanin
MRLHWIVIGALIALSAASLACGGGKADLEALATEAADATPSAALSIKADGSKFNTDTLVAPAGAEVTLTFDNQDSALTHNVAIYTDEGARENLYRGELFQGKETREYVFQAPEAGVYYFRCDVHPDMDGVFITK